MEQKNEIIFPAEWYSQSAVQLTWPHEKTDWAPILNEVIPCFVAIAKEVLKHEKLIIICPDASVVRAQLGEFDEDSVRFVEVPTNDTWARDHGGISVFDSTGPMIYDFVFNGWGMKFAAGLDNQITRHMLLKGMFARNVHVASMAPFVLEGGSIESDGKGTLMTTAECLLSINRNEYLSQGQIEEFLMNVFGLKQVLWLESGYLVGDDTDSHIDTLARFCSEDTIAYVKYAEGDEHYDALFAMEEELKGFRQLNGEPYRLVPLPMADPVYWEGERLPATYANFLIINGAVLVPFYGSPKDEVARQTLQEVFPEREVVGINCLPLIKQHGSLHCVTMQYPKDFVQF